MTRFLHLFGRAPPPPETTTDDVLPVTYWDDKRKFHHAFPVLTLRFDNVLDPAALQAGLAGVFELGPEHRSWRRLAGRIRRRQDGSGGLELHIPAIFTKERPAFSFTCKKYDVEILGHPLGAKLPLLSAIARDDEPILFGASPKLFEPLLWDHTQPRTLDGFLTSDRPPLGLHVVSFRDVTLVTLTWAHVICDAMAIKSLVDAWALVLAARRDDVLPAASSDPMAGLGLAPAEPLAKELSSQRFGFWGMLVWLIMLVVDSVRWRNRDQAFFTACIPARCVERVRKQGIEILNARSSSDMPPSELASSGLDGRHTPNNTLDAPFLSASDVITAFCASLAAARVPRNSSRGVSIINVYSLRKRLPKLFDPRNFVYLQNAQFPAWTSVRVGHFFSQPDHSRNPEASILSADGIAEVAGELRRSLIQQTTPPQIDAFAQVERSAHKASGGNPAVFGTPLNMLVVVTNWSAGKFFDTDFSPAISHMGVKEGLKLRKGTQMESEASSEEQRKLGRPSWVHAWDAAQAAGLRSKALFHIVGVDSKGNHWVVGRVDGLSRAAVGEGLKTFSS